MRQRDNVFRQVAPAGNGFNHGFAGLRAQAPALRVRAHEQRQSHIREERQQAWPPKRRTFRARRQIGAVHGSRKAKAHRRDSDIALIVKSVAVQPHPLAQAVSGRIVPRQAGFVNEAARRLARDQDTRLRVNAHDRARFVRQMRGADAAGGDLRRRAFVSVFAD